MQAHQRRRSVCQQQRRRQQAAIVVQSAQRGRSQRDKYVISLSWAIGLFLGISYGAGFLVKEARSGRVSPRQVFLSCAFMGFAHSVIEDTLLVLALGADIYSVLVGRVIFAVVATGILALLLRGVSETTFMATLYRQKA